MRGFLVILAFLLSSCVGGDFMGGVDFEGNVWDKGRSAIFEFDTRNMVDRNRSVNIFVRYLSPNEGRAVTLYIKTQSGDSLFYVDTMNFVLRSDNKSSLRTVSVPYRGGVQWRTAGAHSVSISPSDTLFDVASVGLEIL